MLAINLQPKQSELLNLIKESSYKYIGFGGSRGGGKSNAVRNINMLLCMQYKGLNTLIFRRRSNDLLENHIVPFFSEFPELRQYFNKTEKMIYFPNGSLTKYGYADNEDDIYDFQGKQYDVIFIDEATLCTQLILDVLKSCNRGEVFPKSKIVYTMNPGGISHLYIKRLFIDKVYLNNEKMSDYYYLPARIYDNVIWVKEQLKEDNISIGDYYNWEENKRREYCYERSDYAKTLESLPEEMRKAYLEGDWDIYGGMFFKGFEQKDEIIEPFAIPREWRLIGALDPGYSSPCSFCLIAQDFEKNVYVVATYYEEGRNPMENAIGIKEFINSPLISSYIGVRKPSIIVSGRDAWARKDRYSILASDITFADVFASQGLTLLPAVKDRKQGWWSWKSLIPKKFFIFKEFNTHLLNEMMSVITDGKDLEDIQGRGNDEKVKDHALDCVRYGIMSLFKPVKNEIPLINRPGSRSNIGIENNMSITTF